MTRPALAILFAGACGAQVALASPFGAEVVSYVPAPGQFINNANYHEPADVLGPPTGGGTAAPNNASVLSLGGFGGSVVIRFDHPVADDPGNYLGLDFIVFGNAAWWNQDALFRWAEPAHVEVMRDVDGDGVPGSCAEEIWYLLPGSAALADADRRTQTWDGIPGAFPPANTAWFPLVGQYPYLPGGIAEIPLDGAGRYATGAYALPADLYADPGAVGGTLGVLANPNAADADPADDHLESFFGYADVSPTLRLGDLDGDDLVDEPAADPAGFYTVPDNPWRVGVTPGSGGGDAFDLAAAIDPATGAPAGLAAVDFVRITSAVDYVLGPLGEVSAEIDAVADIAPVACPGDWNGDHRVNLVDLIRARNALGVEDPDVEFSIVGDVVQDGVHDLADLARLCGEYLEATCD